MCEAGFPRPFGPMGWLLSNAANYNDATINGIAFAIKDASEPYPTTVCGSLIAVNPVDPP